MAAKLARAAGAEVVHPTIELYCDDRMIPKEHQTPKKLRFLTGCDACVPRCGLWEHQKCPPTTNGAANAAWLRQRDFGSPTGDPPEGARPRDSVVDQWADPEDEVEGHR